MRAILGHYPADLARLNWTPLGSAGGFSGATLWRGELAGQPSLCLKAWPVNYPAQRLTAVHRWMTEARAGLTFVPAVVPTRDGRTVVEHDGRVWDLTAWMPGTASFRNDPSEAKLAAACAALAALHRRWCPPLPPMAPCPGIQRRLALLQEFPALGPTSPVPTTPLLQRARELLPDRVVAAERALLPWVSRPLPVFPCLCDIWHDHVLFSGDRVTGVIDYGAMKVDHPAVDLARLLGDLVEGESSRVRQGLQAYHDAGGPVPIAEELVALLDRTGVVCAVIHWLRCSLDQPLLVAGAGSRVARLLGRLESLID